MGQRALRTSDGITGNGGEREAGKILNIQNLKAFRIFLRIFAGVSMIRKGHESYNLYKEKY